MLPAKPLQAQKDGFPQTYKAVESDLKSPLIHKCPAEMPRLKQIKKMEDMKMSSTLWETFESEYFENTRIPWRIYGNHSHRLLCHDYGELKKSELDDMEVIKCTKKNGYWRIVVAD